MGHDSSVRATANGAERARDSRRTVASPSHRTLTARRCSTSTGLSLGDPDSGTRPAAFTGERPLRLAHEIGSTPLPRNINVNTNCCGNRSVALVEDKLKSRVCNAILHYKALTTGQDLIHNEIRETKAKFLAARRKFVI